MTVKLQFIDTGDDRLATNQDIKRALQALIGSFPNSPTKADLSIYGVSLFDEVVSERPSLRVLEATCRKLRRESDFLPTIKGVLAALAFCTVADHDAPTVDLSNLGKAGNYLLRKHGEAIYASWFAKLTMHQDGDVITLTAPTRFICAYVYQHYDADLLRAWQSFRPDVVAVRVVVARGN
jgi:hypothetical protein